MNEIHAHEILRMVEGENYTVETLKSAVIKKFGSDALFKTCSASEMDVESIIDFLVAKGKFKPTDDGFTLDLNKVCSSY